MDPILNLGSKIEYGMLECPCRTPRYPDIEVGPRSHDGGDREEGVTYGTLTWIWSVAVADALYMRGVS